MLNIITQSCAGRFPKIVYSKFLVSGVLVSGMFFSACSTLAVPDWVEGKSEYFTPQNYLIGHGIGYNLDVAEDNASRKITQQFKSVESTEELSSQTNIIFNQIEFEEPWLNTNSNQHHVLAFISRDKAASLIESKMLALDELTFQFFEQAKTTTDLLEQTSYIDSAISAQSRRVQLKPLLKVITNVSDLPSSYNIVRLSKVRDQLQARVNLKVKVTLDKLGELEKIIKNSLDSAGFIRNSKKSSRNTLVAELKIEESPIPKTSGELLMQGVLITSLHHDGDDSVRGQHQWTFSITAKDHKTLIQKSRENLITQLNKNLKKVIMDMMVIEYHNDDIIPNQDYRDFDMPEFNRLDTLAEDKNKNKDKPKSPTDTAIATDKAKATSDNKTSEKISESEENTNKVEQQTSKPESETTPPDTQTDAKTVKPDDTSTATGEIKTLDTNPVLDSVTVPDDPISTLPPLSN